CETGPRMVPSASRATANEASGRVEPSCFSAARPMGTSVKLKAKPSRRSTALRTLSVAAVISGPIPSPCMTARRTPPGAAFDAAIVNSDVGAVMRTSPAPTAELHDVLDFHHYGCGL